jgi:hypothetical protein
VPELDLTGSLVLGAACLPRLALGHSSTSLAAAA